MGRRGPLPKNPALRALHGTEPLTKEVAAELSAPAVFPDMPSHFNPREVEAWNKTIEIVRPMMTLRKVDGAVLGAYCSAFVRWQDAEKQIQLARSVKEGLCLVDKQGKPRAINPLIAISRDAQRDMIFYAAHLGMTPSSRIKMVAEVGKIVEQNPFMKIKASKKCS